MATGRQTRTKVNAPNATVHPAEGRGTTAPPKAKASSGPAYKRTRRQTSDLLAQEQQPSSSKEPKATVEEDEGNQKTSSTPVLSPTTTAVDMAVDETEKDKTEPAVDPIEPAAAGNDTPMENEEKAEEPPQIEDEKKEGHAPGDHCHVPEAKKKFNPAVFRSTTATLQETLAAMNAKTMIHANISCDDLDAVYEQFDAFIKSHPTLASAVRPMLTAKLIIPPPPPPPQMDTAGGGGTGEGVENIAGITADLSSMLANLENNVIAAAAVRGYVVSDGAEIVQKQQQATTQTLPSLRSHWDASSLLQLQPALASALSDRLKNKNLRIDGGARGGGGNAGNPTTTTTTQGGGGAESTVLQEKIRRAIIAAQAGYTHNNNNTGAAAATYNPRMSSELDSHLSYYNQHLQSQMQRPLASRSLPQQQQQNYCQPSAADSAAIATATAAALAGHSRAGVDKTPALELLKALSNINYTGEGPPSLINTTTTTNKMNYHLGSHEALPYGNNNTVTAAAAYGANDEDNYDDDEEEEVYDAYGYADFETDRDRSPTPTINPNTNRPLRRVVVQKAADELAASALVSLGAGAGAAGTGKVPGSKGNTFNRNRIKKTAPSLYDVEKRVDDYSTYNNKSGAAAGSGGGSGGGGSSGILPPITGPSAPRSFHRAPTPQQPGGSGGGGGGGLPTTDVTAKVQLLMLMAQNLGEMQNASANHTNTDDDVGKNEGGSAAGDDAGGVVRSRAASEDVEAKTLA